MAISVPCTGTEVGIDRMQPRHITQLAALACMMKKLASVLGLVPEVCCCWVGGRAPSHQQGRNVTTS